MSVCTHTDIHGNTNVDLSKVRKKCRLIFTRSRSMSLTEGKDKCKCLTKHPPSGASPSRMGREDARGAWSPLCLAALRAWGSWGCLGWFPSLSLWAWPGSWAAGSPTDNWHHHMPAILNLTLRRLVTDLLWERWLLWSCQSGGNCTCSSPLRTLVSVAQARRNCRRWPYSTDSPPHWEGGQNGALGDYTFFK